MPKRHGICRNLAVLASMLACAGPLAAGPAASSGQATARATANCVDIGSPKPTVSYHYRYSDNTTSAEFANLWQQFTPTGSRLVTTRTGAGVGQSTYVSKHQVVNDVFVLEASTASGTDAAGAFTNSMTYTPGAIGDPAYKACEGATWTIAAVTATSKSMQGTFSMKTDPGVLKIVKIRESMTVPAGTFDTVHYIKTMNSGRGQVVDQFWKSIEHGVTVRRTSTQPGGIAVEVLTGIR